jgi:hypothetical protein
VQLLVLLLLQLLHAAVTVPAASRAAVGILPLLVFVLRVVQHAAPVAAVTRGRLLALTAFHDCMLLGSVPYCCCCCC